MEPHLPLYPTHSADFGFWGKGMSKQSVFRVLQFIFAVAITVFLAGVVVPNLLGTRSSAHPSFLGSLYTIQIARIILTFKLHNILSASLGVVFGIAAALLVTSSTPPTKSHLLSALGSSSRTLVCLEKRGVRGLEADLNTQPTR